jgi:hypothetical protein
MFDLIDPFTIDDISTGMRRNKMPHLVPEKSIAFNPATQLLPESSSRNNMSTIINHSPGRIVVGVRWGSEVGKRKNIFLSNMTSREI